MIIEDINSVDVSLNVMKGKRNMLIMTNASMKRDE